MHLNPARFNAHLDKIGQTFTWRKANACPCKNAQSGAANPKCPHCGGVGQIWSLSVRARAGVAGQKTQLQWAQSGQYENGDVVLTIQESSPLYALGQFDRVVMLNSSDPFSLPVMPGQNRIYGPILTIDRVFWIDADSAIAEGEIPSFSSDGVLTWESGAPPASAQYTVNGTRLSEYFCWGAFTSDRAMHHGARLPRKVVLRKFDLFGRG